MMNLVRIEMIKNGLGDMRKLKKSEMIDILKELGFENKENDNKWKLQKMLQETRAYMILVEFEENITLGEGKKALDLARIINTIWKDTYKNYTIKKLATIGIEYSNFGFEDVKINKPKDTTIKCGFFNENPVIELPSNIPF
ncbi:TPA: hypothetical protein ACY4SF_002014 [Clostridium perfringens]|uniref:hypothetical protein n=1 Tax=Clostridium perfringens TaxID=1502 RepID=UPI000F54158D|nr:hypothetical protein [Clostridium perfringens]EHR1327687.1 hypothetical protein [Clostridium perfringens]EHR1330820.1 hypothetical protein [Clostridium perfringens]EHR1424297.1 hypothetical protein [Clostridium perfringens]MDK0695455.1 hypothetical protein [Clostridium perfringens]MDK3223796.1 hypothetical protein [Clostridium perfringens]